MEISTGLKILSPDEKTKRSNIGKGTSKRRNREVKDLVSVLVFVF